MDKIKEKYSELKLLDDRMKHLNLLLEETKRKKEDIINNCSHDLVLAFKEKKYGDLFLWECECLLCKERLDLTLNQRIYSFGDKKALSKRIDLDNIINIIACVSENTREQYLEGKYTYLGCERARNRLIELINSDENLTKEEVKYKILTDLMLFDHQLKNNNFKEYTNEKVKIAIQPDDNIDIMQAVCEDCVDLCSEGAKRKIK